MAFIDQSLKDLDMIIEKRREELDFLRSENEQGDSSIGISYTDTYMSSFEQEVNQEEEEMGVVDLRENDIAAALTFTPGSALELRIQQLEGDRESYSQLLVKLNNEKKECHEFMRFQQSIIHQKSETIQNLERSFAAVSRDGTPGSRSMRSSSSSPSPSLGVRFAASASNSSVHSHHITPALSPLPPDTGSVTVLEIEHNAWFWPHKVFGNEKYNKLVHIVFLAILQVLAIAFFLLAVLLWLSRMLGLLRIHHIGVEVGDNFAWDLDHVEYTFAHIFGL